MLRVWSIISWDFFKKNRCIDKCLCLFIDKYLCLQCKTYFLLCIFSTHYKVVVGAAKYSDSQDYQKPLSAPGHLEWYRTETSACQQGSIRHFSSVGVPAGVHTTVSVAVQGLLRYRQMVFIRTVGEPPWNRNLMPLRSPVYLATVHRCDFQGPRSGHARLQ